MATSISFSAAWPCHRGLRIWQLAQLLLVEQSGTISERVGDHFRADEHAFRLGQESRTMTRVGLLVVGAVLAVVGMVYGLRTGLYERVFPPAPPDVAASLSIDCDQVQFPLTVQPNTSTCGVILEKRERRRTCAPTRRKRLSDQWPKALRESRRLSVQAHEHRKSPDDQRVDVDSNQLSVAACKGEGS